MVRRRIHRSACITVLALALSSPAVADEAPPVKATMQCDRAGEPGRVRCSIEAQAEPGRTIQWADAVVVSLPDFVTALKGRIGREDATVREAGIVKWAFGVVAKRGGQGEARARVRAVACEAAAPSRCQPVTVDVHTLLVVGS